MKILFTSEEVVDICKGKYYALNLGMHLTKYKYLGDIICVCDCREVESTKLPEVDMTAAKFVFASCEEILTKNGYHANTITTPRHVRTACYERH